MTAAGPRSTDPDAPADLVETLESADVVVFVSNLTDIRALQQWLANHGIDHQIVTMGMGSATQRDRFHRLRAWTQWGLLPQIFIAGVFVGGADEFFASAFAREYISSDGD